MARVIAGLCALDGVAHVPLRLESVDIQGTILGTYSTLVLKTTFSVPKEPVARGQYFFPLNADSAVVGLLATVKAPGAPARTLCGVVLEKEAARIEFAAAIAAGASAALLERETASEDVYRLELGCLPACAIVEVEVTYTQTLRANRSKPNAFRLVIPAALVHRYVPRPGAGLGGARFLYALASSAEALANRGGLVDHPSLRLALTVQSSRSIQDISSPSHAAYAHSLVQPDILSGRRGSEGALRFSVDVPKSQWLNPAVYADLVVVVRLLDESPATPAMWAESAFAPLSCQHPGTEALAAAVLVVPRAFAEEALQKATLAIECGASLPAGWRVAVSDEEAEDLALADRRDMGADSSDAMDVDTSIVMPWEMHRDVPSSIDVKLSCGVPPYVNVRAPPEFVFVIDCSGSMGGSRINAARAALQLALRSMPAGSRFQVIRFGSYTLPVFPEAFLVPADESHIAIATAAVASIAADLGGTELWQSLRIALAPAPLGAAMHYARGRGVDDARGKVAGTPRLLGAGSRAVLVLTDGEVANTRELIDSVRADAAKTGARVHCFGIGTSVSTALVQGLADSTGGVCEYLTDGEGFAAKVVQVMAAAMTVDVSVGVDWGLPSYACALPCLPTLTAVKPGDVARLFAAWLPSALGKSGWHPGLARVIVRRGDGLSVRIPVSDVAAADSVASSGKAMSVPLSHSAGRNVVMLAVRSALRALEEAEDRELTDALKRGLPVAIPGGARSAVFHALVDVSTRFGVLCRHTALYAKELDHGPVGSDGGAARDTTATGSIVTAPAVLVPMGGSRIQDKDVLASAVAQAAAEVAIMNPPAYNVACSGYLGAGGLFGGDDDDWDTPTTSSAPPPVLPPPPVPPHPVMPVKAPPPPVLNARLASSTTGLALSTCAFADLTARFDRLVLLQAADGAFFPDERLAAVLGLALGRLTLPVTLAPLTGPAIDVKIWATVVVLAALESVFAPIRESWSLFAKRSSSWLGRALRDASMQAPSGPIPQADFAGAAGSGSLLVPSSADSPVTGVRTSESLVDSMLKAARALSLWPGGVTVPLPVRTTRTATVTAVTRT